MQRGIELWNEHENFSNFSISISKSTLIYESAIE